MQKALATLVLFATTAIPGCTVEELQARHDAMTQATIKTNQAKAVCQPPVYERMKDWQGALEQANKNSSRTYQASRGVICTLLRETAEKQRTLARAGENSHSCQEAREALLHLHQQACWSTKPLPGRPSTAPEK